MNKSLRIILAGWFAAVGILSLRADKAVEISLADGSTVVCPFSSSPVMSLQGTNVHLQSADLNVTWPTGLVAYWHFIEADGIEAAVADGGAPEIRLTGSSIEIATEPMQQVSICDAQGRSVAHLQTDGSGHLTIDTASMPQGVMIVTVGQNRMKFITR